MEAKRKTECELSVIVPLYNEAEAIAAVLQKLSAYLERQTELSSYELIVVNDGSSDRSRAIVAALSLPHFKKIEHPYNLGYGAALKSGARAAVGAYLLFFDGDGQHDPDSLDALLSERKRFDMVVGHRRTYTGPSWRRPGKWMIGLIANYLVSFNIPDLNSGLRVVRRDYFNHFVHLYPNGFSLSTTITLAFLKHGYTVTYVPIDARARTQGSRSSVRLRDGFKALGLILRMIMLFAPFRIFTPISLLLFLLALVSLYLDVFIFKNIGDNTLLFSISALLIFLFGLLAEELASLRRSINA